MNARILAACAFALAGLAATSGAAETQWVNPAVADFGAAAVLPGAGMQPDKGAEYKVVFNVTMGGPNDKINPGLERVARAANIFTSAGVPLSHLHFIAVVHGPATLSVLDNDHYKEKLGTDNPNVKLISELKAAGVQVVVCGQALAHLKLAHDWVNPDVEVTLSAISDVIILEQKGYVIFPM
ncbi:MAG TPA: DsrE family protein [Burkholderiales bacterium]|nr:DsrE family protein [Burkholderiales bacterium]